MHVDLVDSLAGRLGRYPSAAMGGASWFGMIADTNMPSRKAPSWHKFMDTDTPIDSADLSSSLRDSDEHAENLAG